MRNLETIATTITLAETGGLDATAVTVTDDIPAGLTNLTVVSFPSGATNSTVTTGGAYGAGKVDIRTITVAANTTELNVFEVKLPAAATPGTSYANTATVTFTNGDGVGATPTASNIMVSASSIPQGALKHLYLYDGASNPVRKLSRVKPTAGAVVPLTAAAVTTAISNATAPASLAGTYTVPAGVTALMVEVWGAGGAGGGTTLAGGGAGGGGGAYARLDNYATTPNAVLNYSLGGRGNRANGAAGTAGADSWFFNATTLLAKGGGGGGADIAGPAGLGGSAP
jgi:hypothetical protein